MTRENKNLSDRSDRLNELNRLAGLKSHVVTSSTIKSVASPAPSRYRRLAEHVGGSLVSTPGGSVCVIKSQMPWGQIYGAAELVRPLKDEAVALSSFSPEEADGKVHTEDLLLFDTETTGLGGTGAVAFLVGCGSLTNEGLEVRQYLLPDYSDEAAMLELLLEEFTAARTLVSYNGAAFDCNILRDRMIVNRVGRELPRAGNIDLLHTVRRLYRRRLPDCRLATVERELLAFFREGDIPGSMVPSVYFDWLGAECLDDMSNVIKHNYLDIISMYFLLLQLDRVFVGRGRSLSEMVDRYSLARIYGKRRQHKQAARLLEDSSPEMACPNAEEITLYQSLALKRSGDWTGAVQLWEKLAVSPTREGCQANVELAKFFEHRQKDLSRALVSAQKAREYHVDSPPHRSSLRRRIARLQLRLDRASS